MWPCVYLKLQVKVDSHGRTQCQCLIHVPATIKWSSFWHQIYTVQIFIIKPSHTTYMYGKKILGISMKYHIYDTIFQAIFFKHIFLELHAQETLSTDVPVKLLKLYTEHLFLHNRKLHILGQNFIGISTHMYTCMHRTMVN